MSRRARQRLAFVRVVLLALVAFCGAPRADAQSQRPSESPFTWPGGARIAVSLSYDDALPSQLDHALPALDALGLKASFYLTLASETVAKRLPEWRAAARAGHELGNHTVFHPCSRTAGPGRDWVTPPRDLDRSTAAAMREEIATANAFLHAIDGRTERTFTAPCGDGLAGGEPFLPLVKPMFVAIKVGEGGLTTDVLAQDLHAIGSWAPVNADADALIGFVERAAAGSDGRALASIILHGIGGDYLSIPVDAHQRFLKHLAAHPQRYWVAPLVDIATWVRERPPK